MHTFKIYLNSDLSLTPLDLSKNVFKPNLFKAFDAKPA